FFPVPSDSVGSGFRNTGEHRSHHLESGREPLLPPKIPIASACHDDSVSAGNISEKQFSAATRDLLKPLFSWLKRCGQKKITSRIADGIFGFGIVPLKSFSPRNSPYTE